MSTVRTFLAALSDEFLDQETFGIVLIAATEGMPTVASTILPDLSMQLLSAIVDDGDWSDTIEHKPN